MSREKVAERAKLSRAALQNYERGSRQPGAQLVAQLAELYGVPAATFVSYVNVPRGTSVADRLAGPQRAEIGEAIRWGFVISARESIIHAMKSLDTALEPILATVPNLPGGAELLSRSRQNLRDAKKGDDDAGNVAG